MKYALGMILMAVSASIMCQHHVPEFLCGAYSTALYFVTLKFFDINKSESEKVRN